MTTKNSLTLRSGQWFVSALLFMISLLLSGWLLVVMAEYQETRGDIAELNDVKYGLLNAEEWVAQISEIVSQRINAFELTKENRAEIHQVIAQLLDQLIVEVDTTLRTARRQGGFFDRLVGQAKQSMQDMIVDMATVRQGIPQYTDAILDELNKLESRERIKTLIINYLESFSKTTFTEVDMAPYQQILAKNGGVTAAVCQKKLSQQVNASHRLAVSLAMAIIGLNGVLFGLALRAGRGALCRYRVAILILASGVLLLVGILTPMIEVEAKISNLTIRLYGEILVFSNQVLYYQSKSILDVVGLLVTSFEVDLMFVAFLIALFSVFFPLSKLVCSFFYFYEIKTPLPGSLVQFFALKSGKWSMADVMVIAIFMAYIGFDGMLASQLSNLTQGSQQLDLLTTNGTTIQIGFFMFLSFCLASLLVSTLIDRVGKEWE